MKNMRYVLVAVLGCFALTAVTRADPDDSSNPNLQSDADGVPVSMSRPKAPQLTPEDIAAIRKQQVQAALDKDWLLRNYERQLQKNASGKPGDDSSANLYYQLSSNPDLAKLAGLPDIGYGGDGGNPGYRTSEAQPDRNSTTLRSPAANPAGPLQAGAFLKPFITPLGAPDAAGLSNFYSTLGGSVVSPYAGTAPPSPAPRSSIPSVDEDPADIETPGMIAAEKNPSPDTLDLSLDVLPDETIEHARAHQDNNELLALPLPENADQLHRAEAESLNAKGTAPATAPAQPKPIPVNDEDAPLPASKEPVVNPVRAPIANPFDILSR
jgi:hypothetical protein